MSEYGKLDEKMVLLCGPGNATCRCTCGRDGERICEHKWDGPAYDSEATGVSSVTCSRCGMSAFSHDMWVMP